MAGYANLCPKSMTADVTGALSPLGWGEWDGNGLPAFVVFNHGAGKESYFQAGFWAGRGVPAFFVGGRSKGRKRLANQFWSWAVSDSVADLPAVIARRGLVAVA